MVRWTVSEGDPMRKPALLTAQFALIIMLLTFVSYVQGQTLNVLRNWGVGTGDGNIPYSSLIMDPS